MRKEETLCEFQQTVSISSRRRWRIIRERSCSGELPHACLTVRAKERGDLHPSSEDKPLIARVGSDSKRLLTLATSNSSRSLRNVPPVASLMTF